MEKERKAIKAYEGKWFTITLQSMRGSTAYGWTLTSLPEGVAFVSKEIVCTAPGIAPVNEVFDFCVLKGASQGAQEIGFTMVCMYDSRKISEKVNVKITVIPANENGMDDFVEYSDGQASYNMAIPYGYVGDADCTVKYGYTCYANSATEYGYIFSGENSGAAKYGYPCYENAVLKYGYSCGAESSVSHKYGYPCGVAAASSGAGDSNFKYGYPCGVAAASAGNCICEGDSNCLKAYGFPPIYKYGYPVIKYGYPGYANTATDYGYTCVSKYGYQGCV